MTIVHKAKNSDPVPQLITHAQTIVEAALAEAALTDAPNLFPVETFKKLSSGGIIQAVFLKKYGGLGLGIEDNSTPALLNLLKILGYGNLVVGRIFEGHFNAAQLISKFGNRDQIEKLFSAAVKENYLFGVWNTEADDGVKISPIGNGKFRLAGSKTFASGTGYIHRPIVTGRMPDGGWQMCIIPLEQVKTIVDDSWWRPMGMQSSRSYRVDFTNVEIEAEYLIGKPNDYYAQPFFSGGAIRFAAVQLGAAELLFDLTRQFLRELGRTGDSFQQSRLGEMAITVETGNLLIERSAVIQDKFAESLDPAEIEMLLNYAGVTRTAIEQVCQNIMINCERSIGSRGLMKPYHFERVIRDLKIYLRQAAPDAALAGIGKFVLDNSDANLNLWRRHDD